VIVTVPVSGPESGISFLRLGYPHRRLPRLAPWIWMHLRVLLDFKTNFWGTNFCEANQAPGLLHGGAGR